MIETNVTNIKSTRKMSFWEIGMTAPLIWLLFRIPLANIIGNEGNGYMALGWELFTVFYLFTGYGIKDAVRQMVVRRARKNFYHNCRRVLLHGFVLSLILGIMAGGAMYLISVPAFQSYFQLKTGSISFKVLALFMIINNLSSGYQGFFEGMGSKVPTCFSKITNAIVGGTGAIIFATILNKYGSKVAALLFENQYIPGFSAAGVSIGLVCGAGACIIFLLVIYQIYGRRFHDYLRKDTTKVFEKTGSIIKELTGTIVMVILPSLWLYIYHAFNYSIYIKNSTNVNKTAKLSNLGSYYGKIFLLVLLFSVIIIGLTTVRIDKIKRAMVAGRFKRVKFFIIEDIKRVLLFGSVSTLLFMAASKYVLGFFFRNVSGYEEKLLRIGAVNILLISLAIYGYLLLSSLNKNLEIFVIYAVSFILQSITMVILVKTGISDFSLAISEIVFWCVIILGEGICITNNFKLTHKRA